MIRAIYNNGVSLVLYNAVLVKKETIVIRY